MDFLGYKYFAGEKIHIFSRAEEVEGYPEGVDPIERIVECWYENATLGCIVERYGVLPDGKTIWCIFKVNTSSLRGVVLMAIDHGGEFMKLGSSYTLCEGNDPYWVDKVKEASTYLLEGFIDKAKKVAQPAII